MENMFNIVSSVNSFGISSSSPKGMAALVVGAYAIKQAFDHSGAILDGARSVASAVGNSIKPADTVANLVVDAIKPADTVTSADVNSIRLAAPAEEKVRLQPLLQQEFFSRTLYTIEEEVEPIVSTSRGQPALPVVEKAEPMQAEANSKKRVHWKEGLISGPCAAKAEQDGPVLPGMEPKKTEEKDEVKAGNAPRTKQKSWTLILECMIVLKKDGYMKAFAKRIGLFVMLILLPISLALKFIVCPLVDRCRQIDSAEIQVSETSKNNGA